MVDTEPVEVGTVLAPQMQEMIESVGRDERRARTLALEQRVRSDRRPVREPLDVDGTDLGRRGEHRLRLVPGGRDLGRPQLALVREQDRVGERAPDVDAENRHRAKLPRVSQANAYEPAALADIEAARNGSPTRSSTRRRSRRSWPGTRLRSGSLGPNVAGTWSAELEL